MIGQTPPASPHQVYAQLLSLELGDIVTLPDGVQVTVRAAERRLPTPVGSMTGFVLGGEVGEGAVLLGIPASPDAPCVIYTPLDYVPVHARGATPVCEGVVSYWAPHLPNLSGAMGELGYKVCRIRGAVDPMVLIWRGRERVVFIKSAVASLDQLRFHCLPRNRAATEVDQARHAARVTSPVGVPLPEPAREHVGSRYRQLIRR